jgi:hypothetical protein
MNTNNAWPRWGSFTAKLTGLAVIWLGVLTTASLDASTDYGPAIWRPTCNANWWTDPATACAYYGEAGPGGHYFCVIHDMEGYYLATISYFNSCSTTDRSVFYAVNGLQNGSDGTHNSDSDPDSPAGEITQMVREANYAYHALCWNPYMWGTEHEGWASNPAWYSEEMYQASAALQSHLCTVGGIPKDRNHIIGHDEWKNANWKNWMAANFPRINTDCNTHTDPGPYWDWTHFMALIAGTSTAKAQITSPTPGSTFSSTSATFAWNTGSGVTDYWLYAGNSAGAYDIYGGEQGTALSHTVSGIPTDGRTIYVRLYSLINGAWQYYDYTYKAFTVTSTATKAQITSPTPGSTFSSSSATFAWNIGSGVADYWLYVGNSAGAYDIYGGEQGTALSHMASGIPTDGRTIYVRLYSLINGAWQYYDYTYKAFTVTSTATKAQITSPTPGSTFSSSSVAFTWSTGSGVTDYWLYVGNSAGAYDIYGGEQGTALSHTVSGIPTDGRTIYVRLWSNLNSGWQYNEYTYTAFTGTSAAKAQMTSPANGSTFSSSSVNFNWNTGSGVSEYYLYVGNSAGAYDIYLGDQGTALARTVSGIPTDGRTIYVRLWSSLSSGWQYNDYTYTASTGGQLTDSQKQQIMLGMVNQYRGSLPAEAVLGVIFQEGGEGAFYTAGYVHDSWYSASDAPWAQPNDNGDGIMQVTSASGYHERSGTYSDTQLGYDHAIHDGSDFLQVQFGNYGTAWEAILHYNGGAGTLYIYKNGMGDPNYLGHVADNLGSLVPRMFGISNSTLLQELNAAQLIVNKYLNDPVIQSGQPPQYYATYQAQLDAELHRL